MHVITEHGGIPIRVWATDADTPTLEQCAHLSRLPFAVSAVALMPDGHVGYGMPIGGVMATDGVVVPNAVEVDICCGMRVTKTDIPVDSVAREDLKAACGAIRERVPVGFAHHPDDQPLDWFYCGLVGSREHHKAKRQVGTLGGGNHFIELQAGDDGFVYIMVHSGSRNIGKQVADHYNRLAVSLNDMWHASVPKAWELAFLPLDTDDGQHYMQEMNSCVSFARLNREAILRLVSEAIGQTWDVPVSGWVDNSLDIAHNYAAMENHGGKNVLVHRKGATRARLGELGIIPGSQGTSSYIVRGLGNGLSFQSCSHGAGRTMGRKAAERTLDLEGEIARLDAMGVVHAIRGVHDLDEAPGAYKDIDAVMAAQTDLVTVETKLRPLAVVKG